MQSDNRAARWAVYFRWMATAGGGPDARRLFAGASAGAGPTEGRRRRRPRRTRRPEPPTRPRLTPTGERPQGRGRAGRERAGAEGRRPDRRRTGRPDVRHHQGHRTGSARTCGPCTPSWASRSSPWPSAIERLLGLRRGKVAARRPGGRPADAGRAARASSTSARPSGWPSSIPRRPPSWSARDAGQGRPARRRDRTRHGRGQRPRGHAAVRQRPLAEPGLQRGADARAGRHGLRHDHRLLHHRQHAAGRETRWNRWPPASTRR